MNIQGEAVKAEGVTHKIQTIVDVSMVYISSIMKKYLAPNLVQYTGTVLVENC